MDDRTCLYCGGPMTGKPPYAIYCKTQCKNKDRANRLNRVCTIEGCDSLQRCKGLCDTHYSRLKNGYPMDAPIKPRRSNRAAVCVVEGCEAKAVARDLCGMHYYRWRTWGHVGGAQPTRGWLSECSVDGCDKAPQSRGLCPMHYQRWRATGEVGEAEPRRAANGTWVKEVKCSVAGCDRVAAAAGMCGSHRQRWNQGKRGAELEKPFECRRHPIGARVVKPSGYAWVKVRDGRGGWELEHRLVEAEKQGRPLYDFETPHHINGIRDDNRPENLELWVKPQPAGQRPSDLAEWVVEHYPELVEAALAGRRQLRLAT